MKKLLLLLALSFFSTQGLANMATPNMPSNVWVEGFGGFVCKGNCGALPAAAMQNSITGTPNDNIDRSDGSQWRTSMDNKFERSHKFNKPRIFQALCTEASDKKHSNIKRNATKEYWSTYLGGIVNHQSLKEFFSIINSQYSSNCDEWFSTYVNLPFHKVLVFAYERNIIDITGYWAISLSTLNRGEAKRFGLEACENSHRINKMESFTCSILFGNNDIVNKDYLALAKMSEDEYIKAITNYVNQASEVIPSQSELGDFFK
ncbi:hypothetical protein OAR79_02350 [Candidatus Thioglobus sp.]|nr:hypothetical protein [Candidatus Thioglobus sp.]